MTRCVSLGVGLLMATAFVACLDSDLPDSTAATPEMIRDVVPGCTDVAAGQSFASLEAYKAIKAAEDAGKVIIDDGKAATLTQPSDRILSITSPPTFTFTAPSLALDTGASRSWWRRLAGHLAPIGTAWAQSCPPANGEIFLFRLWDHRAGRTNVHSLDVPLYSAMVAQTSFAPGGEAWREAMRGRYTEVYVEILRAVFVQGQIVAGPFKSNVKPMFETLPDIGTNAP